MNTEELNAIDKISESFSIDALVNYLYDGAESFEPGLEFSVPKWILDRAGIDKEAKITVDVSEEGTEDGTTKTDFYISSLKLIDYKQK